MTKRRYQIPREIFPHKQLTFFNVISEKSEMFEMFAGDYFVSLTYGKHLSATEIASVIVLFGAALYFLFSKR